MLDFLRRLLGGHTQNQTFHDALIQRADDLYGRTQLPGVLSEAETSALLVARHLTSNAADPVFFKMDMSSSSPTARTIQASYESLVLIGFLAAADSMDRDRWTDLLAVRAQFEAVHDGLEGDEDVSLLSLDESEAVDYDAISERLSTAEMVVQKVLDLTHEDSEQGEMAQKFVEGLWKGTRAWVWNPSDELKGHFRTMFLLFLDGVWTPALEATQEDPAADEDESTG